MAFRVKLLRQMRISLRSILFLFEQIIRKCLKLANITPVFKPGARASKNNYSPISILPVFSKIFERLLGRQLLEFFDNILYKFQCGFRKGYKTQGKELLTVIKLLVHLSKAFRILDTLRPYSWTTFVQCIHV